MTERPDEIDMLRWRLGHIRRGIAKMEGEAASLVRDINTYKARQLELARAEHASLAHGLAHQAAALMSDDVEVRDLKEVRQRSVQAIGAGISRRDWHATEAAYNELRDRLDDLIRRMDKGARS